MPDPPPVHQHRLVVAVLLPQQLLADPFEPLLRELGRGLDGQVARAHDALPQVVEAVRDVAMLDHELFGLGEELDVRLREEGDGAVEGGVVACSEDGLGVETGSG